MRTTVTLPAASIGGFGARIKNMTDTELFAEVTAIADRVAKKKRDLSAELERESLLNAEWRKRFDNGDAN